MVGQISGFDGDRLTLAAPDASSVALQLDALIACLGISPRLGPIADWGLELQRKQVPVDTEKFETRAPGVFAVGDINTYPGKKKLIVCGFHEATLAAWAAAAIVFPGHGRAAAVHDDEHAPAPLAGRGGRWPTRLTGPRR